MAASCIGPACAKHPKICGSYKQRVIWPRMLIVQRLPNPVIVENVALESDLESSPNLVVYMLCDLGEVV